MHENGRVIKSGDGIATVVVMRAITYDGEMGSEPPPDSPFVITVLDPIGVSVGEQVEVTIRSSAYLTNVLAAFTLPLLLAGLGYGLGSQLWPAPAILEVSIAGLAGGLLGLITALRLLVRRERSMAGKPAFTITRVLYD